VARADAVGGLVIDPIVTVPFFATLAEPTKRTPAAGFAA
jgi:hypothetical protein